MKRAWAALLLASAGCAGSQRADLLEQPLVAATAPPASEPTPLAPDLLGDLLQRVAALRGLEPGTVPALVELPAAQLALRAREQFERDVPAHVRQAQAQLLWRLGLVPRDFDLGATFAAALPGRLEAFYAGEPPTLYLDRALSPAARQRALAHELVHALQDRRHALVQRLRYEPGAWDRQSALHALAEADALAVVEQLVEQRALPANAPEPARELAVLPGVIERSLAAPYRDGRARVSELLAQGGFGAVDAALERPPASSHELLHPGAGGIAPALGAFPAPDGYASMYADVLGEQSLRIVLEEWASEDVASRLSSSWAADRFSVFTRGADLALVWELVLVQAEQAAEIAALLAPAARARGSFAGADWTCEAKEDGAAVGVSVQHEQVRFGALALPTRDGCLVLERWLRATRVPVASSVVRNPARQPLETLLGHREDHFRQPSPVDNFVR